jgi:uncharacterized MAPEG superfamily protein
MFGGSTEIEMLCWSTALGILQLVLAAGMAALDQGLPYNFSPRDAPAPSLGKVGGRLARAFRNFLETFPLFAAAVFAVTVLNKEDVASGLGAQIYFWARLAYVPLYAAGIPLARTLVWAISLVGLIMVLTAAA